MTATYDETLPTDKDKARSLLGDTDVEPDANALHSDEHITAVLALEGSLNAAVVYLAKELIAKYAQEPIKITEQGRTIDLSERLRAWRGIVQDLQSQVSGGGLSFVPATYGAADSVDEFSRPPSYWSET